MKTNINDSSPRRPFWSSWSGVCAILLGAALLFFLITEHTAHFFGALPFGILLLCPLLHIFMHRGHGGHGGEPPVSAKSETKPTAGQQP